jgi:DNA polymerase-1
MEKILLVDGSSILFRAFYALPHFTTTSNIPTSAVYGFLRMLIRIIKDEKPDYLAVAFDKKTLTFRHIEFKEYKAQRPKMPDELSLQFDIIREILDAFDIKHFEVDGFEADDVIATFVEQLKMRDINISILSSDFDLSQLIDENVELISPKKGVTKIEKIDKEKFIQEYGFEPTSVPDYKALLGDPSDNIEGIKGIGGKTATKIIQEFKTVENLLNDKEMCEKYGIIGNEDKILQNKSLCVLVRNVPIAFELESLKISNFRTEKVKAILEKYEFKSIIKELVLDNANFEEKDSIFGNIKTDKVSEEIKVSSQNESKSENIAVVYLLSSEKKIDKATLLYNEKFYDFDFSTNLFLNPSELDMLKKVLENAHVIKYTNSYKSLLKLGNFLYTSVNNVKVDSTLASYLIDPDQSDFSLRNLAHLLGKEESFNSILDETVFLKNNGNDILDFLKREKLFELYETLEMPLSRVLFEMERKGIAVDIKVFKDLKVEVEAELSKLENEIYKLAGLSFNILSPKQLSSVLFDVLGIEPPPDSKGSTGSSTLLEIANEHPIIPLILKYRHLTKLLNSYIEPIPHLISKETNKLHTIYHQIGTATGRLRSTNPNLQNLPVKDEWGIRIQSGFVAFTPDSVLLSADYSQIELRVLAHLSSDENLISSFLDNFDIHERTAMEVFNLKKEEVTKEKRNLAKAINFGIIYGISPYGLSKQIGTSKEEAADYIDKYFKKYPKVYEYINAAVEEAKKTGEARTILGRRRFIRGFDDRSAALRDAARRVAINSPIQGSASDIIKLAMVKIFNDVSDIYILLQIHDELIFELKEALVSEKGEQIRNIMETVVNLKVPLKVDVSFGKNLGAARK